MLRRAIALLGCAAALGAAHGAEPCRETSLAFEQGDVAWHHRPLSKLKRDTRYTLVDDGGRKVLKAEANTSASAYLAALGKPMDANARLRWRWKTDALVEGADNRDRTREDSPVRVMLAFDGDRSQLPEAERKRFERAQRLLGTQPPYALLMYIWSEQVPVGTVITSAHTAQVKMLVVASGTQGLSEWRSLERDVAADYKLAFGAAAGPLLGVAVMTDTDNTRGQATAWYDDIALTCGQR